MNDGKSLELRQERRLRPESSEILEKIGEGKEDLECREVNGRASMCDMQKTDETQERQKSIEKKIDDVRHRVSDYEDEAFKEL